LNKVECTTFKTIISILNSLAYVLGAHVNICLKFIEKIKYVKKIVIY